MRCRVPFIVALWLAALAAPQSSAAQSVPPIWLGREHWIQPVLARLHPAGLLPLDPALVDHYAFAMDDVLPAPYALRLMSELGLQRIGDIAVRAEVAAAVRVRDGAVAPGRFSESQEWIEPSGLEDVSRPELNVRAAIAPARSLALNAHVRAYADNVTFEALTADARIGPVALWAGRRSVGYATGQSGSLVLTRFMRLDGAGVRLHPVDVPVAGRVSLDLSAGRVARNGRVAQPWFVAFRAHARPHDRFDIGATRAALFGGLDGARMSAGQWLGVLVGANLSGSFADDQVVAVDARMRPPLPVPVELYGEWAMHDIDFGVLLDMPTFTVGVRVPRGTRLVAGIEHTQIASSCCGNPPWYHHFELSDGWTAGRSLIGHPLGGHGREWRLSVSAGSDVVQAEASGAHRWRGHENLLADARRGDALAFDARLHVLLPARFRGEAFVHFEDGDGWREVRARLALRRAF